MSVLEAIGELRGFLEGTVPALVADRANEYLDQIAERYQAEISDIEDSVEEEIDEAFEDGFEAGAEPMYGPGCSFDQIDLAYSAGYEDGEFAARKEDTGE